MPAAVVIMGKIRGRVSATISTALYPAIEAIDDNASMLWARVVRGINSTANAVTPVCANCCTASAEPSGRINPTSNWPRRIRARSLAPFLSFAPWHRTCTTTSH